MVLLTTRYIDHLTTPTTSSSGSRRSPSAEQPPDFKTEFHPHSNRPPLFQQQEEFGMRDDHQMAPDTHPWRPFVEQGDYLFAEIALQAGLNASQVNGLLRLISHISQGKAKVTLQNEVDLRRAWDMAAMQVTPVSLIHYISLVLYSPFSFTFSSFDMTWLPPTRGRTGHSRSTAARSGIGL